jgi:hypothetical protein
MTTGKAIAALLLAATALAFAPTPALAKGGGFACPFHGVRSYARKAELPRGALAALGHMAMAERGAPWNASDDVGPGPMLPFARFISARQQGCTLALSYEQGGIAHFYETAIIERRASGWVLVRHIPNRGPNRGPD